MAEQNLTERGMAVGLRALNRLASNPLIDRFGLRDPAQRVLHGASKATVRTATPRYSANDSLVIRRDCRSTSA